MEHIYVLKEGIEMQTVVGENWTTFTSRFPFMWLNNPKAKSEPLLKPELSLFESGYKPAKLVYESKYFSFILYS